MIDMRNIRKVYSTGKVEVEALRRIDLLIKGKEFVSVMGPSGSGKSTLMNLIGCLDTPTSGEYFLEGQKVESLSPNELAEIRNKKVGFVFQNFNLLPRTSALENVAMPLSYMADPLSDREARRRAKEMLCRVGLEDRLDHEPSRLSGGEQQRVAIARALINCPPLLFADEPTGNLDSHTSEEILRVFQQLNEEDCITIIVVTHDANVAQRARRVIHIHDGVVVDGAFAAVGTIGLQEGSVPPATAGEGAR
jgi:ABC-type lipoprotein export system ATPase subunit